MSHTVLSAVLELTKQMMLKEDGGGGEGSRETEAAVVQIKISAQT